jgi:hypothetical protein
MRYIVLIYSETPAVDLAERDYTGHWALMDEAREKGVLVAAEPLPPVRTAKSLRLEHGKPVITDGPFAETREQLAGFYILDCHTEAEALEWAGRISGACDNVAGVEVRAMPGVPARQAAETITAKAD